MKCLKPGYLTKDKLQRHPMPMGTDSNGEPLTMELVNPALALATLFFHPCNFPFMHQRAEAVYGKEEDVNAWLEKQGFRARAEDLGITTATGLLTLADFPEGADMLRACSSTEGGAIVQRLQDPACTLRHGLPRVYEHPFTCDKAIAAQAVVDAKPVVDGETHVLLQANIGSDKADVSQVETEWPQHLKVTNLALTHWFQRQSKAWLSSMAVLPENKAVTDVQQAKDRHDLYQKQLTLLLICLEECARNGIHCTHKSPPPHVVHPDVA